MAPLQSKVRKTHAENSGKKKMSNFGCCYQVPRADRLFAAFARRIIPEGRVLE